MKKILLAVAAIGLISMGAPSAVAAPADQVVGGCGFSANSPPDGNDTFTGEIDVTAVVHNGSGPVEADFHCDLRVNGQTVATLDASTTNGVAIAAEPITYVKSDGDTIQLCQTVTLEDGEVRGPDCGDATELTIPPPVVRDLIIQITSIPDPLLCPVLAGLAGDYVLFKILADGDIVFIDPIGKFWDCPPYDPIT